MRETNGESSDFELTAGTKRKMGNETETEYTQADGVVVSRQTTTVERESNKRRATAAEVVSHLPAADDLPSVEAYVPQGLSNAIFCGHLVTDLDSIAGAIGAAELYGGVPARASEINSETAFALKLWGVPLPQPIEELLVTYPQSGVCLVDHQQTSQLNPAIDVSFTTQFLSNDVLSFCCVPPFAILGIAYRRCHRSPRSPERHNCD